jgi:uncharacterized OB-fold protein
MPAPPPSLQLPIPTEFSAPFWEAARQRKLVIQYCPESGKYQHYPRPVSIYTGKRNVEWREVSGKGFVYAMTITRRGPPAFRGQEPYLVATVELDEGVRLLTQIVNCNVEDARIGMRVRVRWRALNDEFSFPVFEPDA